MTDEEKILEQIRANPQFRRELGNKSLWWFFRIYFWRYIKYKPADFQQEMLHLLEDPAYTRVVITAFRRSAKSTLASLVYVIWSLVGTPQKKYIVLASETQELAKQMLTNVKLELETNQLLIQDFGPFVEVADEWRSNTLLISTLNARITAISPSEGVRGLRHMQYRPDLIVIDDVEDLESVRAKENRDRLWQWLNSEMFPLGDIGTKFIIVGNLLHEDSLMMRLKEAILAKRMEGIYREYPLINDQGVVLWPQKYPTQKEIDAERKSVPDEASWYREFLLKIISDNERIVQRGYIKYYTEPFDIQHNQPRLVGIGVDLAVSTKDSANNTALVPFIVSRYGDHLEIRILPYIVNKKMDFTNTIKEIKRLVNLLRQEYHLEPYVFVEGVGFQDYLTQQLAVEGILAESVPVSGMDKKTRLTVTSPYIRLGKVQFPQFGAEELITQIVNFGIEKMDDLADAFTIGVISVIKTDLPTPDEHFQPIQMEDPLRYNPATGQWEDMSKPLTAGLWNKKF